MYFLTKNRVILLRVFSLLLIFHTTLFAGNRDDEGSRHSNSSYINELDGDEVVAMPLGSQGDVAVSLDSFGNLSMIVILLLTSLLGMFFVRHELSSLLQ